MTYTINSIQAEMRADGSHWWDKGTMRYFGCKVCPEVYQGPGGIYFVTSEKPPSGKRAYSVRKYNPDTKDIDTIGNFCALSKLEAHQQAAEMAGSGHDTANERHKVISEAEQLALDIRRNGGNCTREQAATLIGLATRHHELMEAECNIGGMYDDDGEPIAVLRDNREAVGYLAKRLGCGVRFSGDPRGCTVKLILPSGEANDWGKEGWCVPTID